MGCTTNLNHTNPVVHKMAKLAKPLTNTEVQRAKPREKDYELSDGSGLILRVRPRGTKVWLFKYQKPFTKARTNIALGTFPEVSLADARQKRLEARELLASDKDPKDHWSQEERKNKEAHTNTLEAVVKEWLEIKKTKVSADFAEDIRRSLELHIFPSMKKMPVHQITALAVIDVLKPIAAKGSLETVRRLCQRMNEVMIFATNTGLIHHNPLSGIKEAFVAPQKTNLPTIKPEALPSLMENIQTASIRKATRYLILWQLHTMVRPGEAAATRWDEIDFEKSLWNIPAERMKKKKAHTVPLTKEALGILEKMKGISGNREHVFPGDRNPRSHMNESTANMAIKRMGYQGELVAHGLRSIASTVLNENGFDADLIEASLAHADKNQVRTAYNRAEYIERRRPLMEWWSKHIQTTAASNE
jgi:integrase